jgi:arylsulfatase A-like enzyme
MGPFRPARARGTIARRLARGVAGLLIGALAAVGCSKPSAFTARNVVLVVIDGVGAGDLGCGGDPGARTPFWDRLARRGAQFPAALSPSPREIPALASILSGEYPDRHGLRSADSPDFHPPQPPLAEILRDVGIETAGFPDGAAAGVPGLARGFLRWETGGPDLSARRVAAVRWLDGLPPEAPYLLFVGGSVDEEEGRGTSGGAVAAVDRTLAVLLREIEAAGRLDRTLVVATATRGARGPTGGAAGERLRDAALRVPLVAWGPFPFRLGVVRPDPARLIDLHPTVLEAIRVGAVQRFEGRALHERLDPWKTVETYAEAGPRADDVRSLRDGDWKLVRGGPGGSRILFDLSRDPRELHDLAGERPDVADDLGARLEARRPGTGAPTDAS